MRLLVALALTVCSALTARAQRAPDQLLTRSELQQLVEWQTARDAPALIEALRSRDAAVRARAAFALASVQDSAATTSLLTLLTDEIPEVRADAAFALGQQPAPVPAAPLLEALEGEPAPTVRHLLLEALGKQGDANSLTVLATSAFPASDEATLAMALSRYALRDLHDEHAVQRLIDLLHRDDSSTRQNAAYYFGRSRHTAPWADQADAVRAWLDAAAPDDPAAMHVVRGLGRLADSTDVRRLTRWLHEASDWRTRTNAAGALASFPSSPPARQALFGALDDSIHHVRISAAEALAEMEWDEDITEAICTRLAVGVTDTSAAAARMQGALLRGLARTDWSGPVAAEVVRRADHPRTYRHALNALAPLPFEAAFPLLREAARHSDARVAYAALTTLAGRWRAGRDSAQAAAYYDVLAQAVRRADLATVYATASLLSDSAFVALGSAAVLAETYQSMEAPDDIEGMTALLGALGAAGELRYAAVLREALDHPYAAVRTAAADALADLTGTRPAAAPSENEPPEIDWTYLQQTGPRPRLVFETECGPVTLILDAEQAPLTTQTILRLTERGAYDGVTFHRVVPNFVVQGGDFARGDGFGGPGYVIRSEFTRIPYARGTMGMASAGKDTEGSQFFVTHSMQPHLDGRYTAFGTVIEGMEAIDCIQEDDMIMTARTAPTQP